MAKRSRHNVATAGFILPTTLWFIAIVTIAVTVFAGRVSNAVEQASAARQFSQSAIAIADTQAEVIFRLTTSGFTRAGYGQLPDKAIIPDSRLYRGPNEDLVSFQDARGLLNINFADRNLLSRLLVDRGVMQERVPALLDTLGDFVDADHLRRLNGAEAPEYVAAGLPLPKDEMLVMPNELHTVFGWGKEAALWQDDRFIDLLSTRAFGGFNPATAPSDILLALPTVTREEVVEIMRQRKLNVAVSTELAAVLARKAGIALDAINVFPSESLTVVQVALGIPYAVETALTLTPLADDRPWRIDYFIKKSVKSVDYDAALAQSLPPLDTTRLAKPSAPM